MSSHTQRGPLVGHVWRKKSNPETPTKRVVSVEFGEHWQTNMIVLDDGTRILARYLVENYERMG